MKQTIGRIKKECYKRSLIIKGFLNNFRFSESFLNLITRLILNFTSSVFHCGKQVEFVAISLNISIEEQIPILNWLIQWHPASMKTDPVITKNIWKPDRIVSVKYINNIRHLRRKYARIFVRGHYLFRVANSFPRAKLEENCELRGTDNVQGHISEHIFAPFKSFSQRTQFWKLGDILGYSPVLAGEYLTWRV